MKWLRYWVGLSLAFLLFVFLFSPSYVGAVDPLTAEDLSNVSRENLIKIILNQNSTLIQNEKDLIEIESYSKETKKRQDERESLLNERENALNLQEQRQRESFERQIEAAEMINKILADQNKSLFANQLKTGGIGTILGFCGATFYMMATQ